MRTLVKIVEAGAQPLLICNSNFFNNLPGHIKHEVLIFLEAILREHKPEIFKEKNDSD